MKSNYRCSQMNLYTALRMVWSNFLLYWALFEGYKELYNEAYAATALAAIQAAEAMPDHEVNTGESEVIRIELQTQAESVCWDFAKTKGYINTLYKDKNEREKNYKQAGEEYYDKALKGDWDSTEEMGKANKIYVTTNAVALKANDNMPDLFPTTVGVNSAAFASKHQVYMSSKDMSVETSDKIKANNDCYDTARDMMYDASVIFRNDEDKAKKFVWDRILKSVGVRQAGLEGTVKDKTTKEMLEGVIVELQLEEELKFEVVTDANGKFSARGIIAGKYSYRIICVGKKTITGVKEVKTSRVSRMKFEMENM